MPVNIGEMDVQVAPSAPPSAAPSAPRPQAPDRDAILRVLAAEADRRARLHAD